MRALARLVPSPVHAVVASLVALAAACSPERHPTGVAPDSAASRPQLAVAAAALPRTFRVTVAGDSGISDPDITTPANDFVCDTSLAVARPTDPDLVCSFRMAVANHHANPGAANTIEFKVDSIRLSGFPFPITGMVTIDGRTAPGGRVVVQGPWEPGAQNNVGLSLNACASLVTGLVVRGFGGGGIDVNFSSACPAIAGNRIEGNYVGTDRSGSFAVAPPPTTAGGVVGILVNSSGNTIVGNVVGGHRLAGVTVSAPRNVLQGNRIGIGTNPIAPMPNGNGVMIYQPQPGPRPTHTVLGGTGPGQGNVIVASADSAAVVVVDADSTRIEGNRLGVGADAAGTAYPNRSAIQYRGVSTSVRQGVVIRSNTIGGSRSNAIDLASSFGNQVTGNVITGAAGDGIRAVDGANNLLAGNTIDRSGGDGIDVEGASTVGVDTVRGNAVRRSRRSGVYAALAARGIVVVGNRIEESGAGGIVLGTNGVASGDTVSRNTGGGVRVRGSRNTITGNVIDENLGAGVAVELPTAVRNTIRRNAISWNGAPGGLGIDLVPTGVTPNDALDADAGANDLQNFPVLDSARATIVVGRLASAAGTTYKIDLYASPACDDAGHGEGATYLDSATVTTNAGGTTAFTVRPATPVPEGWAVTATATDAAGSTSEFSPCALVPGTPPALPIAEAGGPYSGVEGGAVQFSSAGSRDPKGGALTYAWYFGDGNDATAANPTNTYAASGSYRVALVVRNPARLRGTDSATATIANVAPTVDIQPPLGARMIDSLLSFPHRVTDPGGASDGPWQVTIAWGDKDTLSWTAPAILGDPACPAYCVTHRYRAAGTYTVTMSVRDKDRGIGSDAVTVVVAKPNQPPVAVVSAPSTASEGSAVAFGSAGSSDPEGGALKYLWDFGDNSTTTDTSSAPAPTWRFPRDGVYPVTLTVTDPLGAKGSATKSITITDVPPAVALRVVGAATVVAGSVVTLEGSFTDPGAGDAPWNAAFKWNDLPGGGAPHAPGTTIPTSRKLDQPGTYTATLQVTDRNGVAGVSPAVTVTVLPSPWVGWQGVGSGMAHAPVVVFTGARTDLFVRSADGVLWHRPYVNNSWLAWTSLGVVASNPAVASWTPGQLDIFVRGTDNALWHRAYVSGGWAPWESLGGSMLGTPAAVSWGPGRLDIFVRGVDNALYHLGWQLGYGWSGWEAQGGGMSSDPVVVSWGVGRLDVFVRGTDNALWHKCFENGWSQWNGLGGALAGTPAAASWGPGRLDVFIRGATDNALWHLAWQNGAGWSAWEPQGGSLTSEPVVVASSNPAAVGAAAVRLDVFARGADNALYHKYFFGGWSGWSSRGGSLATGPGVAGRGPYGFGFVDVLALGTDGVVWHRITTP